MAHFRPTREKCEGRDGPGVSGLDFGDDMSLMWGMVISDEAKSAIRASAKSLGARDETIRKWFQRGVPGNWHLSLLAEAKRLRLRLSAADLLATRPE